MIPMNVLPQSIGKVLRRLMFSGDERYCPICEKGYGKFMSFGIVPRAHALCPGCNSLERHRLLWIALKRLSLVPGAPGKRLLHISPELCLSLKFQESFDYVSIDLDPSRALLQMNVTQLRFPDGHFDAIVCNHVLEHVQEDRKALLEIHRVLKTGGWASIQVPMKGETTTEGASIVDPAERERLFGQTDHVRSYGRDFLRRLEDTGFRVLILAKQELADTVMVQKISVECEDEVWISMKA